MSQTPTKGPCKAIQWNEDGDERWIIVADNGTREYHIATIENGQPGDTLATEEATAKLLVESLNIHHETKQTPRQILESREALRGAVSLLITIFKATADAADIDIETTQLKISRGGEAAGGLTIAEFLRKTEALTLAKEGGPK